MSEQQSLFNIDPTPRQTSRPKNKDHRHIWAADNMRLPVHRWFRYPAGFSARWAAAVIRELELSSNGIVFDPFAGSATTMVAADECGVTSIGIDAHPFVVRIANAKLAWECPPQELLALAQTIVASAEKMTALPPRYPEFITRSYAPETLIGLHRLKKAWLEQQTLKTESELAWLALTSILRRTTFGESTINKAPGPINAIEAFRRQIVRMLDDMRRLQQGVGQSRALTLRGDARGCPTIPDGCIDAVISSPPSADNDDYADATRLEMAFWGEIRSRAQLHRKVRQHLIVSSSRHAAREIADHDAIIELELLDPIREELSPVASRLAEEHDNRADDRHYHTMIATYFADMARVWRELRRVCKPGARVIFATGDVAPYDIHVPVERWLGELAVAAGFARYRFEKVRDRRTARSNDQTPLHEGHLIVE